MDTQRAIEIIQRKSSIPNDGESFDEIEKAYDMAVEALKKQMELRENCEGSCIDCKYRGEFHCANDLLIDSEV